MAISTFLQDQFSAIYSKVNFILIKRSLIIDYAKLSLQYGEDDLNREGNIFLNSFFFDWFIY